MRIRRTRIKRRVRTLRSRVSPPRSAVTREAKQRESGGVATYITIYSDTCKRAPARPREEASTCSDACIMPGRDDDARGAKTEGKRERERRRPRPPSPPHPLPFENIILGNWKKEEREKKRKDEDIKNMAAMIILTDIIVVNIIFTSSSRGILLLKLSLLVVMWWYNNNQQRI